MTQENSEDFADLDPLDVDSISDPDVEQSRPSDPDKRHRSWACTVFRYDTAENWKTLPNGVTYMVWQEERSPDTQRLHLQLYVQFKDSKPWTAVGKILGSKIYRKPARSGPLRNRTYCTKIKSRVSGPWELGVMTQQGKRNDLAISTKNFVQSNFDYNAVPPDHLVRYSRGFQFLESLRTPLFRPIVEVVCIYGAPGIGKTKLLNLTYRFDDAARLMPNIGTGNPYWFDSYHGHDIIIMDEFTARCPYDYFNLLCNVGYSPHVPYKGGFRWGDYTKVIIITNKHPTTWYKRTCDGGELNQEQYESYLRRVGISVGGLTLKPLDDTPFSYFIEAKTPTEFQEKWASFLLEHPTWVGRNSGLTAQQIADYSKEARKNMFKKHLDEVDDPEEPVKPPPTKVAKTVSI